MNLFSALQWTDPTPHTPLRPPHSTPCRPLTPNDRVMCTVVVTIPWTEYLVYGIPFDWQ